MLAIPQQNRRILFDLSTSLRWLGQHAVGIVRTEREIAARILADQDLDVVPVVFHDGQIRAISMELAFDIISSPKPEPVPQIAPELSPEPIVAPVQALLPTKRGVATRALHNCAKWVARGVLNSIPHRSREDLRLRLICGREALKKTFVPSSGAQVLVEPDPSPPTRLPPRKTTNESIDYSLIVYPNERDVLFLCGLGWDVIDCKRLSVIKADSGLKIVSVMYDLIPIKFPDLAGGSPRDYFHNYFLHMVDLCEHIFCISKCTQDDLIEFMREHGRNRVNTSIFYLGANISAALDASQISDESIRERLGKGRFALSVGTFEIRKNYRLLLDIWPDLVADPAFDLDLVIVGMPGWGNDDIIEKLGQSPLFGKRIFWFNKMGDGGLSWLYENCNVFVFPSLYEGWGLPVVEALQHKKPVIVSDRGSSPEAGLGVAMIVDIDNRQGWIDAIRKAATGAEFAPQPAAIPTWDEAAHEARTKLLSVRE